MLRNGLFLLFPLATFLPAQILSNSTLSGKYFARHVQFTTDANNNVTDARSIAGAMTFDGSGHYSFSGLQVIGTGSSATFSVASGAYSVDSSGIVTLANPQKAVLNINARYGVEAVVGSSTDSGENTYDLFVAIPAPSSSTTLSLGSLKGNYFATNFELNGAATSQVRDMTFAATFDGSGGITSIAGKGHAANSAFGSVVSQTLAGGAYTVNADGTGTLLFPPGTGVTLIGANKNLQISQSGNLFLGASPGAHDILIGVKGFSGAASNASLAGRYWQAGLRVDTVNGSQAYTGSGTVIASHASLTVARREHELGVTNPVNYTGSLSFTIAADGSGSIGVSRTGLGTGGLLFTAGNASTLDPTGYEISLAVAIPTLSGAGVFVNPQGVVNAASFAPAGDAISPGEFIAIYGSGLAPATKISTPPYPPSLGGVSVTINNLTAPVYLASSGQVNCLVPYSATGKNAVIVVTNNNVASNPVTVPLGQTSPGIFSADQTGVGDGAIVHLDGKATLVNAAAPAAKGETLAMFLTGLGALTSPIPDGTGATAADPAVSPVLVLVNGIVANAPYTGAGIQFPGLYQINFTVPANLTTTGEVPLAIQTPDAFHDMISLAVQ